MKIYTFIALLWLAIPSFAQWHPVGHHVMTDFAQQVNPQLPWPEYPRPQMERKAWMNLNGLWHYALTDVLDDRFPPHWDGQILVPFAIESALSGVGKNVRADQALWYEKKFMIPASWKNKHILLHFDAVDWQAEVYVNRQLVGTHEGGYDAFSFDITSYLKPDSNELMVRVWDPTDAGYQPRGKQVEHPEGIWYTAVTGIWQTVWLEPVPETHIVSLKYFPDIDRKICDVETQLSHIHANDRVRVIVYDRGKEIAHAEAVAGENIRLQIPSPHLWSPDDPFLYDVTVQLWQNGKQTDEVHSYMGMRQISVERDAAGIPRIMLNHHFLFQLGFLDQGWWPDGLYTPPTDSAIRFDLYQVKAFGYNLLRKHVKVEPQRWYYWCDKLGILVWQDMPSGDLNEQRRNDHGEIIRSAQSALDFQEELKAMIDQHFNHPSIIMWVPFNEGWGQFQTIAIDNWVKKYDPTRLVDGASGWFDFAGAGDVEDMHKYPGPGIPEDKHDHRARVLGEYGGLGLPIEGHTWQPKQNWGYVSFPDTNALRKAYIDLINQLPDLIRQGLCAAVYTQLTDVEVEVNGFMTYDRKILKLMSPETVKANHSLYEVSIRE
ncbi:glycoside hydrolase family 2 protein [Thermoflavifilum thermophilum]|uniref:Glycosyl hydrolases family 2, TIM barrel domain n=1 Tax=Thermoflavifilum thermophilum TaxID=1393122 RepID=A0A1I7NMG5_9BACT|nr:sugar-binding domain-containing protein [Thermoflavifilum thermophilum]SFV35780.1 Glycosyl hydrolases family 2, TIM barrel domain [Thermoflavifilum thermophilum]